MFELIEKVFMGLLISMINESNHKKCVLLSNQNCMIQPTLINLHPNEYCQEFHYCPFAVMLDKYDESCNTLNELSNKLLVPNKTKDLNLIVSNMITGIKESKLSCKCISRFDRKKCNSDQWYKNDKCPCECKKCHVCEKAYIWNPSICSCKKVKHLASIIDNSVIRCDEVIEEETKTLTTNFNEKNGICKTKHFYILLTFC